MKICLPRRPSVALWRVAALLAALGWAAVAACSNDNEARRPAPTSPPVADATSTRPPFFSPTPGGIAGPVRTAQAMPTNLGRDRAEAFLSRIALQEADVPSSYREVRSALLENEEAARRESDPAAARARFDRVGRVLGYERVFAVPDPPVLMPGGPALIQLGSEAIVFATPGGASEALTYIASLTSVDEPALDRIVDPDGAILGELNVGVGRSQIGEMALAWRQTGPQRAAPEQSATLNTVLVRRGPVLMIVRALGAGDEPRRAAEQLAERLDARAAAALRTGP